MINVMPDQHEFCNRAITVYGTGGKVPRGGTTDNLWSYCRKCRHGRRFLTAMLCLGDGVYRLHGVPRMHERPQAALFEALRELAIRSNPPMKNCPRYPRSWCPAWKMPGQHRGEFPVRLSTVVMRKDRRMENRGIWRERGRIAVCGHDTQTDHGLSKVRQFSDRSRTHRAKLFLGANILAPTADLSQSGRRGEDICPKKITSARCVRLDLKIAGLWKGRDQFACHGHIRRFFRALAIYLDFPSAGLCA